MKESTWRKIKEFDEIATKSLTPEMFDCWEQIMNHYKIVHFECGTVNDIDESEEV